ncbi:DUF6520 family protein [Chitinophaga sp. CF118]|uniref:DUF6520 family protein n=1 Tax=Chitinophaga sp. CF118 TaxID=1884367 RepID=UPI0021007064|nr:DUF6520 family protein [Chitinophaga sp. CF118]
MKKNKFPLLALAIILAAGGAVANSLTKDSRAETQYYLASDGNYYPAGVEGYDYECAWSQFGACTYHLDAATGNYVRTKYGKILFIR